MVRTRKIIFRVLQIISRVLQVPIFRNNYRFGGKVFTFLYGPFRNSKHSTFVKVRRDKSLNGAIYTSQVTVSYLEALRGDLIIKKWENFGVFPK